MLIITLKPESALVKFSLAAMWETLRELCCVDASTYTYFLIRVILLRTR